MFMPLAKKKWVENIGGWVVALPFGGHKLELLEIFRGENPAKGFLSSNFTVLGMFFLFIFSGGLQKTVSFLLPYQE